MKKLLSILSAITLVGTASTNIIACGEGEKPSPTPDTRIDISDKISSSIDLGQLDTNTASDFLTKLQTALTQITDLTTITTSDYDVYKAGTTTVIENNDIIGNNSLNIKIVAKGNNFKGIKDNITINYIPKDTRIDISTKITSPIALGQLTENTAVDFLIKLQEKLISIPELNSITTSDYDVYKAGTTTVIENNDIIGNNSLNIKIVAKGNNFKGIKDNIN